MPRLLATDWIESEIDNRGAEDIEDVFPSRLDDDFRHMIERELGVRIPHDEEDTTVRHTLSARTVRWAFRKAKLADRTRPFRRISPARLVERAVKLWRKQVGPLLGYFKSATRVAWTNLKAGLLRALSGCTHRIAPAPTSRLASDYSAFRATRNPRSGFRASGGNRLAR